jgi:hypothetical protein
MFPLALDLNQPPGEGQHNDMSYRKGHHSAFRTMEGNKPQSDQNLNYQANDPDTNQPTRYARGSEELRGDSQ